ncbi:hypothetical protein EDD63_12611 [Breznakia blatticola]|uniref:Uncharacterized protein n=1 Tax=Breznakia blatticola TaxID=1754012 RepID=A0A4R7ZF31_9FIRM|nr:hypothetical protein [Breznakia blatticola]TDW16247.1 hypothetical protein EDD63_12611 [Breznakia blatticola]
MIKVNKNVIEVNKKKKEFEYNIRKYIQRNDKIFILLEIPMGINLTRKEIDNIICVNLDLDIIWIVKNIPLKQFPNMDNLPFEAIRITENNELRGVDFYGRNYCINQNSGELISFKVVK